MEPNSFNQLHYKVIQENLSKRIKELEEENKQLREKVKSLEHTIWRWEEGDWARD